MDYHSGIRYPNYSEPDSGLSFKHNIVIFLASFIVFSSHSSAAAEIYKWVDENGRIHYGDKPESANSSKLDIKESHNSNHEDLSRESRRQQILDVMANERQEKKRQKEESNQQAREKKLNCDKAKNQLVSIENASYLMEKTDDPYNPKILSDTERSAALRNARKDVTNWCSR